MLTAGSKLGPYEIQSPLGAGGMGEVYRARDTRLDREVAIKVLPSSLSSDHSRKQRFEREAKAISKLSHPHICTLHDIGQHDGIDFLVMELLEGETLEQRLTRGALPPEQPIRYAAQIADALAKAHKNGVTHRDLKPANIMLTKSGAKLMDFGLAKQAAAAASASAVTAMTMEQKKLTGEGTIVGTFQYMAPEQLEGKEADARTDIFALGEVIYEMATGRPAFSGKSQASLIAAILSLEPQPMTALQPMTPPALERLVKKCLAKDPDERWQNASDLAIELNWLAEGGAQAALPAPGGAHRRNRERLAWTIALASVALSAGLAAWPWLHPAKPQRTLMSTLLPPPKASVVVNNRNGPPAISPDGAYVAFVANEEGTQSIWIRSLDAVTATRLPGTENGYYPFWSPDSRWLAFYADGKLRKVPVSGGAPRDICAVQQGRGGSWGPGGTILLTPQGRSSPIYRVAEDGGNPVQITKFQEGIGSHRWPYFLPDGKHFLYLASPAGSLHPGNQIRMASADGKEDQLVLLASSNPVFADGWLLFVREGTLMAAPMDGRSGKVTGEARALLSPVVYDSLYASGAYSVSDNGILLYQSGRASNAGLQWASANGKMAGTLGSPADYEGLRIAPDDKRVAVTLVQGSGVDVWVLDLLRSTTTRVTFNGRIPASSVAWSPDERWVAYSANVGSSKIQLFRKSADGTGEEQPVAALSDRDEWLSDWSPDGRYLLFSALDPDTQLDVWAVPSDGSGKPFAVVRGPHAELNGRFSPDGRWVAYVSDESGRNQVYLVPFQHGKGKSQVSTNGGNAVVWARDGKALYYTSGQNDMWAVRVVTQGDTVELSTPQQIFNTPIRTIFTGVNFDVTRDGRFLINTGGATSDEPLVLVQNWKSLLNH